MARDVKSKAIHKCQKLIDRRQSVIQNTIIRLPQTVNLQKAEENRFKK